MIIDRRRRGDRRPGRHALTLEADASLLLQHEQGAGTVSIALAQSNQNHPATQKAAPANGDGLSAEGSTSNRKS